MVKSNQPATERVVSYVTPSTGYWVIPSEQGDFHLAQALIPAMTQADAIKHSSPEGFRALDVPAYMQLFKAMYDLKDKGGDVEKAREFVQATMRNRFPNTLTSVKYASRGKDTVVHNYEEGSSKKIRANIVGEDGLITDCLSLEASLALTGKKPAEVAEIMSYLNKTPAYIWRVNSKPTSVDERVVWFIANSDGASLNCDRNPSFRNGSLGVRGARKK